MSSDKVVTKMCSYDKLFLPLVGLYFYDVVLDTEVLQTSLDKTIQAIPILSSVVKEYEEEEAKKEVKKYYLEHITPSNVPIKVTKTEDEEIFNTFLRKDGVYDLDEGKKFHNLGLFDIPKKNPRFTLPMLDSPLLTVTLINVNDKKSILVVAINHCIADMHSMIYFINRWCMQEEAIIKTDFIVNRTRLLDCIDTNFDFEKVEPKIKERTFLYHTPATRKEDMGMHIYPVSNLTFRFIHFSKEKILEMKKSVKVEEGVKFSSNDCISAHLWKLHASLGTDKTQEIPLVIVMNLRNRVNGLDSRYFGNASMLPGLILKKQEVIDADFTDLVLKIRDMIDNSPFDEMFETCTNCLKKYQDISASFFRKTTLYIDDWRIFDHMLPSFQGNKCVRGLFAPPLKDLLYNTNQFSFVYQNIQNGGIDIQCSFPKEVYEKIENFDLTSTEDVKKINEIFSEK